jgi:3-phenylpropionate/cinnamic acid dioxygenase small subunit
LTTSLSGQEAQLLLLDDERRILDTLHRYGHTIDYQLEDEWMDCFTEDATWETHRGPLAAQGRREETIRGRSALQRLFAGFSRPPEWWNKHILAQPRLEVDGDRCTVHSYFMVLTAHPTGSFVRVFGRYRDRLVRCPDGRWRFEQRVCEIDGSHPISEPRMGPDASQSLAIEEIKRVMARYCHLLDDKRWSEWAALLTDDAEVWLGAGSTDLVQGREAILARFTETCAGISTLHEVVMPDIEITGPASAQATWRAFTIVSPAGDNRSSSERRWDRLDGRYERDGDGHWRIRTLRVTLLRVEGG